MKTKRSWLEALIAGIPVLAAIAFVSVPASAGDQYAPGALRNGCFTYPAVAMAPYDVTANNKMFRKTHERVYFSGSKTGTILLYGPVHNNFGGGDGLVFKGTYIDPDGPGTGSQVLYQLRHVGPAGITVISTLRSNNHAFATNEVQWMSDVISSKDMNRYDGYYVVRAYITRTSSSLKPVAFGYNICGEVF